MNSCSSPSHISSESPPSPPSNFPLRLDLQIVGGTSSRSSAAASIMGWRVILCAHTQGRVPVRDLPPDAPLRLPASPVRQMLLSGKDVTSTSSRTLTSTRLISTLSRDC